MLLFLLALIDDPGDRLFIEELFTEYEYKMYSIAIKILKDSYLAEDAVQEAFVSIIKNLHNLNREKNIEGYLFRCVRNQAYDILRHNKHEVIDNSIMNISSCNLENIDASERIDNIELIETSARLILLLPKKLSEVFILYYYDDYSCTDISRKLKISYDAAFKRLQRAKDILKGKLQEEDFLKNA